MLLSVSGLLNPPRVGAAEQGLVAITRIGQGDAHGCLVVESESQQSASDSDPLNPDPLSALPDHARVLYLDFEGGVVDVAATLFAPFDDDGIVVVPSFADSLRTAFPTLHADTVQEEIILQVQREFDPFDVFVTGDRAEAAARGGGHFEQLYVGGGASMFGRPEAGITTATVGIAEVDPGNVDPDNIGFILVDHFRSQGAPVDLVGALMGVVAAHEFGHEFGLQHIENIAGRMHARVAMNVTEFDKTWRAGLVENAIDVFQDSAMQLARDVGHPDSEYPSDTTPDDFPDTAPQASHVSSVRDLTGGPVTLEGIIDAIGDVDVIPLRTHRAGVGVITIDASTTLQSVVVVLDENAILADVRRAPRGADTVQLEFSAFANLIYYVYIMGHRGTSIGDYSFHACVSTGLPPIVLQSRINNGDSQRSRVNVIDILFGSSVDVDLNAIELHNLGVNAPADRDEPVDLDSRMLHYDPLLRTLRLTFNASLPDGHYELRLPQQSVVDCSGRELDGDSDGVVGPDFTLAFHRFAGDMDGDADIDLADYLVFQSCFAAPDMTSSFFCVPADLDFDGDVDLADQVTLLSAFTGPTPHVGPDDAFATNILIGEDALSELSIDIHPLDSRNQVVVGHAPDLLAMNTFFSLDGGRSWSQVALGESYDNLAATRRFDPAVIFDRFGTVYVGYGASVEPTNETTVIVARSMDGGRTYSSPIPVATSTNADELPGHDQWRLASGPDVLDPDGSRVCMAWTRNVLEDARIDQQIVITCSTDGGQTFSDLVIVNDPSIAGTRRGNRFAAPAIGPNGEVYVVWHDVLAKGVFIDVSFDGGRTFGSDRFVATSLVGFLTVIEAQFDRGISVGPTVDVDRSGGVFHGRIYVAYTAYGASGYPNTDILVRHSDDHGRTWSDATRINDDRRQRSQFLPWLDVDQSTGLVGVVWYDARNDPQNARVDVYFASSDNGGSLFGANVLVSDAASDMSRNNLDRYRGNFLEYIGLAVRDCVAYPVWADNSKNPADLDYLTRAIDVESDVCPLDR